MNTKQEKGKTGDGIKAGSPKPAAEGRDMLMSYESIVEMQNIVFSKKVEAVKAGVSKDQLIKLKEIFELDYDTLSMLLAVTNRSLHLKKGKDVLNRNVSDRLIAIADVFSLGYNIFGDRQMFHDWLRKPSGEMEGATLISVMDTILGIEEVKKLLQRLAADIK